MREGGASMPHRPDCGNLRLPGGGTGGDKLSVGVCRLAVSRMLRVYSRQQYLLLPSNIPDTSMT